MCSGLPQPPDAITGMPTLFTICSMSSMSYPFLVPSVSEEVELDEAKYQVNYSKNNKLFSKNGNN